MSSLAVYVHFPFCLSICPYCDFDRQASGFDRVDAYLAAVRAELGQSPREPVHSVFFGGGTPGDADLEKLHGLRAAGVNRLSIGVQSLDDAYLHVLGRRNYSKPARKVV